MPFNTKSSLLYQQEDEDYSNKPSYYKRSNLLPQSSTASFRQKYKGFRTRSSSYTSIDENKKEDNLLNSQDIPVPSNNTSFFSRKNLGMTTERSSTAPPSCFSTVKDFDPQQDHYEEEEDDEDSDESTFFAKRGNYSRQNLGKSSSSSSWKSCVLRAVGVKQR